MCIRDASLISSMKERNHHFVPCCLSSLTRRLPHYIRAHKHTRRCVCVHALHGWVERTCCFISQVVPGQTACVQHFSSPSAFHPVTSSSLTFVSFSNLPERLFFLLCVFVSPLWSGEFLCLFPIFCTFPFCDVVCDLYLIMLALYSWKERYLLAPIQKVKRPLVYVCLLFANVNIRTTLNTWVG